MRSPRASSSLPAAGVLATTNVWLLLSRTFFWRRRLSLPLAPRRPPTRPPRASSSLPAAGVLARRRTCGCCSPDLLLAPQAFARLVCCASRAPPAPRPQDGRACQSRERSAAASASSRRSGASMRRRGRAGRPSPLPPRTRQPLPACPPPRRLRAPRRLDAPPHHRAKASRPRWRSRPPLAPRASPPLACPVVPPPPLHPCLGGPLAPRRTRSTHLSPSAHDSRFYIGFL